MWRKKNYLAISILPNTSHQTKTPMKPNTRFFVSHHGGGFKRCIAHWQSAALLGIQVPLNHNCTWGDATMAWVRWHGWRWCSLKWNFFLLFGLSLFDLTFINSKILEIWSLQILLIVTFFQNHRLLAGKNVSIVCIVTSVQRFQRSNPSI